MKTFINFLESISLDTNLKKVLVESYQLLFEGAPLETRFWKNNLEKYRNRDDIYVTFTELPKIGINPKNQYKTPTGIYTYNMKDTEAFYKGFNFPYTGSNAPNFVNVLNYEGSDILDLSTYSADEYMFDIEKLKYLMENIDPSGYKLVDEYDRKAKAHAIVPSYGGMIWYVTKNLANGNVNKWNYLLRSMEYNAIRDKGQGIIHTNEPCQTIFLSNKGIELIEQIPMKGNLNSGKSKNVKNMDDENIDRLVKTNALNIKWGVSTGNINLITKLLKSKRFSIDELSRALLYAIEMNKFDIVKILINAGAEVAYEEESPLKTAIKYADSENDYNSDIIEYLIHSGADSSIEEFSTYEEQLMERSGF